MAYRYAVLWEYSGETTRPAGIVLDRGDHVVVEAPNELHIPTRYDEPFVVGGVASPMAVTYRPHDRQFFDQVLIDLSRTFAVAEQGTIPTASDGSLLRLLRDKIWTPLRESHYEHYAARSAGGAAYPAVRRYQEQHYGSPADPATTTERPAAASTDGSFVAA